jgi:hypothetical protein
MDVFISYAEEDVALAEEVAAHLQQKGVTSWRYTRNSESGADYSDVVDAQIKASRVMVVLLSPQALKSHEVTIEVNTAGRCRKRIIPILVGVGNENLDQLNRTISQALGAATKVLYKNKDCQQILSEIARSVKAFLQRERRTRAKRLGAGAIIAAGITVLILVAWPRKNPVIITQIGDGIPITFAWSDIKFADITNQAGFAVTQEKIDKAMENLPSLGEETMGKVIESELSLSSDTKARISQLWDARCEIHRRLYAAGPDPLCGNSSISAGRMLLRMTEANSSRTDGGNGRFSMITPFDTNARTWRIQSTNGYVTERDRLTGKTNEQWTAELYSDSFARMTHGQIIQFHLFLTNKLNYVPFYFWVTADDEKKWAPTAADRNYFIKIAQGGHGMTRVFVRLRDLGIRKPESIHVATIDFSREAQTP